MTEIEMSSHGPPALAFSGVTLVGIASSGRANVSGLGLSIASEGITVTSTKDAPPRMLGWQGVKGLRILPESKLPDDSPATPLDVALHTRTLRFLLPAPQVDETSLSGLTQWAATRPFSAFSTTDDLDALNAPDKPTGAARMKKELNTPFLRIVAIVVVLAIIAAAVYFLVLHKSTKSTLAPAPTPVVVAPGGAAIQPGSLGSTATGSSVVFASPFLR